VPNYITVDMMLMQKNHYQDNAEEYARINGTVK